MPFLKNAWYVAAWSEEIEQAPNAQTIIGQHVVLFRDTGGHVIALGDTCPHRFAPSTWAWWWATISSAPTMVCASTIADDACTIPLTTR